MKLEQNWNFHIYPPKDNIFQALITVFSGTGKNLYWSYSKHAKIKFADLYLDSNYTDCKNVRIIKTKWEEI